MTATGRPDGHPTSTRFPRHRLRLRRGPAPARFRFAALRVGAIVAAILTGATGSSGVPAPAATPAPPTSAPVSVAAPPVAVPYGAERAATASVVGPVLVDPVSAAPGAVHPVSAPGAVAAPGAAASGAAAPGAAAPGAAAPGGWAWPVGPPREVLSPFEAPASRYAAGHRGIDLVAGEGHPVRSPADGVVTFVGRVVDRPVLSIQHGEDLVSSFEPVTATVREGDRVLAGQIVGVVATGAHCTARCVHFGVRRHGQYISPILFLGGLARAVLLPLPPTGPLPNPAR